MEAVKKCCGKCAFRNGSPERCLPGKAEALMMQIGYQEKDFYCHETVDGHFQAEPDKIKDGPKLCAGFAAHKKNGFKRLFRIFEQSPDDINLEVHTGTLQRMLEQ